MAARKNEISLRVLLVAKRYQKCRVSKGPCNVPFIIQIAMKYHNTSLSMRKARFIMYSHSNGDLFTYEDIWVIDQV